MNVDLREKNASGHIIHISERRNLTVTGVEDVQSFDDTGIILKTNLGMLAIDGTGLHITHLSRESGEMYIEGEIGGAVYFDPAEDKRKKGFRK